MLPFLISGDEEAFFFSFSPPDEADRRVGGSLFFSLRLLFPWLIWAGEATIVNFSLGVGGSGGFFFW